MTKTIGWREWVGLPDLGIQHIKAKIDTGARTSALHAFNVELGESPDEPLVYFKIHPFQKDSVTVIECSAPLVDQRTVRDSGGHSELRYVIQTSILIGGQTKTAEITLTDRDGMGFRMLLGRTALKNDFLVDPAKSYLLGRPPRHKRKRQMLKDRQT